MNRTAASANCSRRPKLRCGQQLLDGGELLSALRGCRRAFADQFALSFQLIAFLDFGASVALFDPNLVHLPGTHRPTPPPQASCLANWLGVSRGVLNSPASAWGAASHRLSRLGSSRSSASAVSREPPRESASQ